MKRLGPSAAIVTATLTATLLTCAHAAATPLVAGDLLVADINANALFRVDPVTGMQTTISSGGYFDAPSGVVMDRAGAIYVADHRSTGDDLILRIDPATGSQTIVSQGGLLTDPHRLAIDGAGQLLVVDQRAFDSGAIFRIDPLTGHQSVVSSGGLFQAPLGIAVGPDGMIYVTDHEAFGNAGGVIAVDPVTGAQTEVVSAGGFSDPMDLAFESSGDLIVTDAQTGIFRVDMDLGTHSLLASGGDLYRPFGVDIDADGMIFVVDHGALGGTGAIFSVDPITGSISTVSSGGSFQFPLGIAVVPQVVPEPTSIALLAAGTLTLVAGRRRRRQ